MDDETTYLFELTWKTSKNIKDSLLSFYMVIYC